MRALGAVEAVLLKIGGGLGVRGVRVGVGDFGRLASGAGQNAVVLAHESGEEDRAENVAAYVSWMASRGAA